MKIRLVGNNIETGIYEYEDALKIAKGLMLDLVQINKGKNSDYNIYKVMDLDKYRYEQKKREKNKHQHNVTVKEIRLTPNISDNDLNTKVKQAIKFAKKVIA